MSKARLTVSIDQDAHKQLINQAEEEGRTPANLAGFLLTKAIRNYVKSLSKAKKQDL